MHRFRIGLKARFIGLILVLLTTIFVVVASVLLRANTASLRNNLFERSSAFAALATAPIGSTYVTYRQSGTLLITQQINNFTKLDSNVADVTIVDTTGSVKYSLGGKAAGIPAEEAQTFQPLNISGADKTIRRIIYPYIESDGRHRYAVVYDISSSSIDKAVMSLARSIVIESIIGLVISAIVTYLLVNQLFLKPIKHLRDRAMIISAGNYTQQIPHKRNDEIGDLARSVNQMADSLKADIQKLKEVDQIKSEFMMIASHNLRTPLSIIEGYLQMAQSQALSDELRGLLQTIGANSQRLGIFAEDLLIISGIESGQKVFTTERMTLGPLLETMAIEFKVLARDKKVRLNLSIDKPGPEISGSKPHLRGAVWNLLENALKFTPEGGEIDLSVKQVGDNMQISVKDTGIGISAQEVSKLFTKFHRGTSTERYNYEGTGIGLYVTKLIITEHKGSIAVDSTPGQGSTFTIILPIAEASIPSSGDPKQA